MQQSTPRSTRFRIEASITPQADDVERKTGCFVSNNVCRLRMNVSVKIFKILAAMSDHRPRKSGHRLRGNFDRAGREKLVVRNHKAKVERGSRLRKCNGVTSAQCYTLK